MKICTVVMGLIALNIATVAVAQGAADRKRYAETVREETAKKLGGDLQSGSSNFSADGPEATLFVFHRHGVTFPVCNELATHQGVVADLRKWGFTYFVCTDDENAKFTFDLAAVSSQVQPKPLSNDDIIQMVSLGIGDDVIIEKIRSATTTNFDTSIDGLKLLKGAKVGDAVLKVMINPLGSAAGTYLGNTTDQAKGITQRASATISGKVFAITKGGDFKPARLAAVYLIYHHSEADSQALANGQLATAGTVFDKWRCPPLIVNKGKKTERTVTFCNPSYALMVAAYWASGQPAQNSPLCCFKEGMAPVQGHNAPEQIQDATADEEGVFTITTNVPGHYLLVVEGRAGMNQAIWLETLNVELGKQYNLKMSTPISADLDTN